MVHDGCIIMTLCTFLMQDGSEIVRFELDSRKLSELIDEVSDVEKALHECAHI